MKRIVVAVALVAFAAAPVAAQWAGMPVWNSPKGGTGITISGDFGSNNDNAGGGSAFGGRATLGLANLTLSAGVVTWGSDLSNDQITSFGGTAAFRIIGGSLLPVAINLQLGAGRTNEVSSGVPGSPIPATTTLIVGAGASASLPTPGVSIEPYLSLSNRWYAASGLNTESNFGWTLGANLGFGGMFGIHAAYDSENASGSTGGIIGLGAHVQLKVPLGL